MSLQQDTQYTLGEQGFNFLHILTHISVLVPEVAQYDTTETARQEQSVKGKVTPHQCGPSF